MAFDSLFTILKKAGIQHPSLQQRINEAEALARWDACVGAAIAKHARPLRVQDHILWIEVDHPIWQTELHHRKNQILTLLNRESPQLTIQDLFFVSAKKSKS